MGVSHVPDVGLAARGALNSARAAARGAHQSTNEVLMVAPTAFGFNNQVGRHVRWSQGWLLPKTHFHSSAEG